MNIIHNMLFFMLFIFYVVKYSEIFIFILVVKNEKPLTDKIKRISI